MIPYPEALRMVLDNIRPLSTKTVPVDKALGGFLARPVKAPAHSPRFEQSAMDGYAVRMADVAGARPGHPVVLKLADEIPAGNRKSVTLKKGQTVKVFTGSRLPRGVEAVVMKEYVALSDDQAAIACKVSMGDNIRRVGEEYRRGDVVLPAGVRVTPPVVGMLVMLGKGRAVIRRLPTVTVITMGNELVAPGTRLGPGQIPDSNGPSVTAALRALGVTGIRRRRVKDKLPALVKAMKEGLENSDLVVTVGGASVGDYDYVHDARKELGVRDIYTKVAIKPGKPNLFGLDRRKTPVFGLPGNPVSALVSFHGLLKPAVLKMMGSLDEGSLVLPVKLNEATRKKPGRLNWLRGRLDMEDLNLTAELVTGQESHMLSGLAMADILVEIPLEAVGSASGETLLGVKLDWDK
ncbi:MAG: molybdopterin molybdotransferase MoeA [Candidatus Krumholzibacteria bacterium]|nr:molybdopterin molybdotransferase MoeA [Candidatus Krumholzibacteria bacterium]